AGVEHHDAPPGPRQRERRVKAGDPGADDRDVGARGWRARLALRARRRFPPIGCVLEIVGENIRSAHAGNPRFARSSAISSFFESLPTAVWGRLSRSSISAGISWRPSLSLRNPLSSSKLKRWPRLSTIKAFAASPR